MDGKISDESLSRDAKEASVSKEASGCTASPEVTLNDSIRALEVKECTNVLGLKVAPLARPLARRLQVITDE
jgi:hypothetical protein